MDFGALIPVVAILSSAWVIVTITRARTRLADRAAGGSAQENLRLTAENEALKSAMRRAEERLAVLERIATDPAERTAREIESLR
jgi:hypothetical protein